MCEAIIPKMVLEFITSDIFNWVILPLLIFVSRVVDVSIGTIRLIFVSKGMKYLAPILGFFEIMVWLLAARQIMVDLPNLICLFAYAFGFSAGTYVGMVIEEKSSVGEVLLRIITKSSARELLNYFENSRYHLTVSNGTTSSGRVHIIYLVTKKKDAGKIIQKVRTLSPKAFYSVEDVRYVYDDEYMDLVPNQKRSIKSLFTFFRKSK